MKPLLLAFGVCFIVGIFLFSGCELVTTAGGPNRYEPNGADLVINEIYTLSPDKYYAFTWIELFNPTKRPIPWFGVTFPSEGVAVGTSGTAISTNDDGATWDSFSAGSSTDELRAITFPYTDTAIAAGSNGAAGIVRKLAKDASGHWSSQDLPGLPMPVNDIAFPLQSRVGYCVTDGGRVYRSLNFGLTWSLQNPPVSNFSKKLRSLGFVDFSHVWTCGDSGTIVKRLSASSWTLQTVPSNYSTTNLYSIFFSDDTGWAVGENGAVLHTRNGGENWLPETSGVSVTLRSGFCGFTSATGAYFLRGRAWLCGDNGVILRTDNNGGRWYQQNSQTSARLNKIVFADSLKGWAFGDNGVVLSTTDGGSRWRINSTSTSERLLAGGLIFPPTTVVLNYYELSMLAQKKHYFIDPVTQIPNTDFIVSRDTGYVHFIIAGSSNVPVQGFTIISNDSSKFKDHFRLGPGQTNLINYSFGFDTVIFRRDSLPNGQIEYLHLIDPLLWNLLSSGEIRLEKKHNRLSAATGEVLSVQTTVLDIVRYGNYRPSPDPFTNDQPLGFLPDGWSISRFANDFGLDNPTPDKLNTSHSFYMTKDPIPGWYSQESRPE